VSNSQLPLTPNGRPVPAGTAPPVTRRLAAAAGAGLLLAAGFAAPNGWLARLQAERGEAAALASQWRAAPIAVDGKPDEWSALTPFEAVHLAVGVSNDDRTLQIALTSSDQARRRQLVAAGVIVWLDAGGGKKRSFGVRFPGLLGGGTRPELARRPDRRAPDQPAPDHPPLDQTGGAAPADLHLPPLTWFELMGPGKDDRRRLERSAVTSIQIARELREGMLVLELQVPLAKEAAAGFGIGAEPGRVIGLGLETPEFEKPEGPPPGRGGRGGGRGMGGGMGGMGGGMGRGGMGGGRGPDEGPRGERVERAKSLKVWTTVQLAGRPGS
jgi:hypothetical protein